MDPGTVTITGRDLGSFFTLRNGEQGRVIAVQWHDRHVRAEWANIRLLTGSIVQVTGHGVCLADSNFDVVGADASSAGDITADGVDWAGGPEFTVNEYRWQFKPGTSCGTFLRIRPNAGSEPIIVTLGEKPDAPMASLSVVEAEAIAKALLKAVAICRASDAKTARTSGAQ